VREQQLIQADKMASLGLMISGVAHEINNPNNFIMLNIDILTDIWKEVVPILDEYYRVHDGFELTEIPYKEMREKFFSLLEGITQGAERIREIVKKLKDFARLEPEENMHECNLNEIIESAIVIVNNYIRKATKHFNVHVDSALPPIRGNFQQLEQVLINLFINACQSLSDVEKAVTVTTFFDKDEGRVFASVVDEGVGIAEENLKHLVDPFFTTKRESGGTGLGLSVSYTIVKEHKGTLEFESTPGVGTTARLGIPVWRAV